MAWENLQRDVLEEFARYGELAGIRYGNEAEAHGLSLRGAPSTEEALREHHRRTNVRRRAELRRSKLRAPRTCRRAGCGQDIRLKRGDSGYCSRRCRGLDRSKSVAPPAGAARPCKECKEGFTPRRRDGEFCSTACGAKYRRREKRKGKDA